MKQDPLLTDRDEDRIERALEGFLSEEEWVEFQAEVVRDGALRTAYVERATLHAQLKAERHRLTELLEPRPGEGTRGRWNWRFGAGIAALAASLVVATGFLFLSAGGLKHPVATLIEARNCKWAGSDLPTLEQSKLGVGTLNLVEGIATLRFESGATVTLEAPSKLQILTAMHCRLIEGSVVAEAPKSAHGFTIDTPDLKVKDLGTRFGVTAGSAGNSQVLVFKGEVEVGGMAGREPKLLTEGKNLTVGSGNAPMGQEPLHGLPIHEADGWTAIPTSFGRGKDAYVRRGDTHGPTGAHPLLMVKHSEIPASRNNERRAFLTFDLSQIKPANIVEAQLVLAPVPSGLGFSALVPDSRFSVYAVTDEALDGWNETELLWPNAPASSDAGIARAQARKVAEFWIPRGGVGGPLTIRGDELAEAIRGKSNGLITFIIVRETGESDPSGLVHAFASKEHPTARPPTLRIR